MKRVIKFVRNEIVLIVAIVLAVVSIVVVPPDFYYIDYIDYRTLGLLFSLMIIMSGFQSEGVFRRIGNALLKRFKSTSAIILILVLLCFFFSMIITNDVALITFVPFALEVITIANKKKLIIPVVVMQTIAANLGSMLTPLGNPQNLFLYSVSGVSIKEFIVIMAPYTGISLVLVLISVLCIEIWNRRDYEKNNKGINKSEDVIIIEHKENDKSRKSFLRNSNGKFMNKVRHSKAYNIRNRRILIYAFLFVLALLSVIRIVPWPILLCVVILVVLMTNVDLFKRVDYSLLFTFVAFFVFVGNISRIDVFSHFLGNVLKGHEVMTSVLLSQVISNVPAALLLSGFTYNYSELLIGVNIGGLGTLIASMASLISFKQISLKYPEKKKKYFIMFSILNVLFIFVLLISYSLFIG